jgi:hypothetical protein
MKTKLLVYALICALTVGTTGCPRIHSPGQEELAHDVRDRYKTLTPSAVQALEGLDADLDKLIESQRADFEIYKETSESQLATITWGGLKCLLEEMETRYTPGPKDPAALSKCAKGALAHPLLPGDSRQGVESQIATEKKALEALEKQSDDLDTAVKQLNKGLKEAEKKRTLQEQLGEAKRVINATLGSVKTTLDAVQKDPNSPLSARLSVTVKGLSDFLDEVNNKPEDGERVFSLVVEAMRLGRDIAALEQEVVEQEASYHQNVIGLLTSKLKIIPDPSAFRTARQCFDTRYPGDEKVQARVARLAYETGAGEEVVADKIVQNYKKEMADYEAAVSVARAQGQPVPTPPDPRKETPAPLSVSPCPSPLQDVPRETKAAELRYILEQLALVQSTRLTDDMRIKELELRLAAEKLRNTQLKEAIFERQRMTLVSFGLDGVVRYAEGGLRAEDIANLINIARAIAEGVIAARV